MKATKILGWILFISGLFLIFYSLISSYNIFTGKSLAPEIFQPQKEEQKENEQKEIVLQRKNDLNLTIPIQELMNQNIQEQLEKMMPSNYFSQLLNLISWSIFAGILILGGAQISNLGIKLTIKNS